MPPAVGCLYLSLDLRNFLTYIHQLGYLWLILYLSSFRSTSWNLRIGSLTMSQSLWKLWSGLFLNCCLNVIFPQLYLQSLVFFLLLDLVYFFYFYFIHMCIQCLGHFSPLPAPPSLPCCSLHLPPYPLATQQKLFCPDL
jgi:hypothetical protein